MAKLRKPPSLKRSLPERQQEIHIRISNTRALGARELAATRRVPIPAIHEAAIKAY